MDDHPIGFADGGPTDEVSQINQQRHARFRGPPDGIRCHPAHGIKRAARRDRLIRSTISSNRQDGAEIYDAT
jgi:glyoxylase-like metal-dependent hydrolase (beta-lactamase superfamily II)